MTQLNKFNSMKAKSNSTVNLHAFQSSKASFSQALIIIIPKEIHLATQELNNVRKQAKTTTQDTYPIKSTKNSKKSRNVNEIKILRQLEGKSDGNKTYPKLYFA